MPAAVAAQEEGGGQAFDGRAYARTLGSGPGVYRMLGEAGRVLYVGKARNLRKRVESYFSRGAHDARITRMLSQVRGMEVILTRTEAEALLLESQLVKALKPRYNIDLRDDKSYPWIRVSADPYPRIAFHRGARPPPDRYYGPYPTAWAVRETLNLVYRAFGLRQCEDSVFRNRTRPCLQHQIGRCSAPCVGLVSAEDYAQRVYQAGMLLEGRSTALLDELGTAMERASRALEFERAAELRDRIGALRRVLATQFVQGQRGDLDAIACVCRSGKACVELLYFRGGMSLGNRSYFPRYLGEAGPEEVLRAFLLQHYLEQPPPDELLLSHDIEDRALVQEMLSGHWGRRLRIVASPRGERARWVEMAQRTGEAALATALAAQATLKARFEDLQKLLGLEQLPQRLECFDISHTQGEGTVASCVVFDGRGPLKSDYRRFNIEGIEPGDDYAAMRQAVERRYQRIARGEALAPDLLLIDGGRGQLRQAVEVLDALGLHALPVCAVAKGPERRPGEETLILASDGIERSPGPASPGLHLIQQIRDEAHRFAITGHRGRREKARERSELDSIRGIGAKRKRALLKAFGGLRGVQRASVDELATVDGIDRGLAQRIHEQLQGR